MTPAPTPPLPSCAQCTRALARDRLRHRPGLLSRLAVATDVWAVELRMTALRLLAWFAEVEAWLRGSDASAERQQAALKALEAAT